MRLATFERGLRVRLARAERAYLEAVILTKHEQRHVRRHKLEGAVSDSWQAYCDFVRSVCVHSALGAVTVNGTATGTSIGPATWQRASHIASAAAKGRPVIVGGQNGLKWREPTWGDASKISGIVTALAPTNAPTLIANFAGSLYGPPHCQKVRNACAHKNDQNLDEVKKLAVYYVAHAINLPTDALTWTDAVSGQPAFVSWLGDMRGIAANAIS